MKHHLSKNQHTITVSYNGELRAEHSVEIVDEILKLISAIDHTMNIIMDVSEGFSRGYIPIIKGGSLLLPHLKRFNCCYIVGDQEEKYAFALKFFKTIGAAQQKIFFMKSIDEAREDADRRWEHYKARQ